MLIDSIKEVVKTTPSVRLKIIGSGFEEDKLKNRVKKYGLSKNVKFLGKIENRNLYKYYKEATATIVPSIWIENWPFVVMESLHFKTPVIGSNIGGIKEQITSEKKGVLFERNGKKDLIDKINMFIRRQNKIKLTCLKNPKVSVIIPVYNGEKTLRACLDSVLNQAYKNYEVIVVDNNSTDKTGDIINEFQKRNKRVKHALELKKGRGSARNKGVTESKGDIIVMTDSDCIVPENWIEELIKPILYKNESIVMGFEKDLVRNYWTKNIQKANWNLIKRNLKGKYVTHVDTKNFAIKAWLMKKLMFDSELEAFEDFDFYLRLKKLTKIRFLPLLKVGHNHKASFVDVTKLNFNRAYWLMKIYRKHKKNSVKKEFMTESISFKNFILFPFWMVTQFIKRPQGEVFFILLSEISWRMGILWAIIKNKEQIGI